MRLPFLPYLRVFAKTKRATSASPTVIPDRPGPSDDYKACLRGEISAEEYIRRLKRDVDARLGRAEGGRW